MLGDCLGHGLILIGEEAARKGHLLTTAPGSRRPWELVVLFGLLELTGFLVVVRAGLMLIFQN